MIVNRYKGLRALVKRGTITRSIIYKIITPLIKFKIKKYINNVPLFSEIEIETINRCNGVCPFCPVNRNEPQREYHKMTEALFKKIINELADIGYSDGVGLYCNNEPFLDTRIIEFAKYAREKLPNAFIHLYTNGELLKQEELLDIMNYLSRMIVDNYNDELKLNPNSIWINELCKRNLELNKKVEIHLRKINEVLYTRGNQSPNNNQNQETLNMLCAESYTTMVVRPDGKVSLCCSDALGKHTLGDCNSQTLTEIWYSRLYDEIREKMSKGRLTIELCKYCDSVSPRVLLTKSRDFKK